MLISKYSAGETETFREVPYPWFAHIFRNSKSEGVLLPCALFSTYTFLGGKVWLSPVNMGFKMMLFI